MRHSTLHAGVMQIRRLRLLDQPGCVLSEDSFQGPRMLGQPVQVPNPDGRT